MNYRHGFHAGNFADVHKHVLLVALLDHLRRKPTAFCYVDTHAGRGAYDLGGPQALRSLEWQGGIGRMLTDERACETAEIRRYLEVLEQLGFSAAHSSRYPGSPLIASSLLRAVDRAVCIEQQPDEAAALSRELAGRKRTTVICGDGYRQLKAELPPRERRGLVLIDPPYERASEMAELAQALTLAWTRWPTGVFAAWYPIKAGAPAEALCDSLASSGIRKILCCELCVRPRDAVAGLNGSGLLIVNPPWQLDVRAREIQAALLDRLAEAHAASRVEWLVPE